MTLPLPLPVPKAKPGKSSVPASAPKVEIWTDGGCRPNPGKGGWGVVIVSDGKERELSGAESVSTNNRMELTAAAMALEALTEPSRAVLHTDSNYLREGITKWVAGWVRKGWRTSTGDPVKNVDLWQRLMAAEAHHSVEFKWVKAHNFGADRHNERCDALCTAAIEGLS